MKKVKYTLLAFSLFFFCATGFTTTCLNTFNTAIDAAWDQYDLDRWECNDQGLGAHPDCEPDAMDRLEYNQTLAVVSFNWCCATDPACN